MFVFTLIMWLTNNSCFDLFFQLLNICFDTCYQLVNACFDSLNLQVNACFDPLNLQVNACIVPYLFWPRILTNVCTVLANITSEQMVVLINIFYESMLFFFTKFVYACFTVICKYSMLGSPVFLTLILNTS